MSGLGKEMKLHGRSFAWQALPVPKVSNLTEQFILALCTVGAFPAVSLCRTVGRRRSFKKNSMVQNRALDPAVKFVVASMLLNFYSLSSQAETWHVDTPVGKIEVRRKVDSRSFDFCASARQSSRFHSVRKQRRSCF